LSAFLVVPKSAAGFGRLSAEKARERRALPGHTAPLRVFLVEDSILLRDTIIRAVTDAGHIEFVGHADSERQAVEGINRCLPDVVIVDICLREGNGLDVLRSVTQMIWIRLPILIVLTNHPYPEYSQACRRLGADYFFDKSTEFEDVGNLLETLAGQKSVIADD
jgi:DNA-binding NarL/FixJ family response regulator